MSYRGPAGRPARPGLIVVLALVLIVGGCWVVSSSGESNNTGSTDPAIPAQGGTTTGRSAAPPRPNLPTWTGTLRITDKGFDFGDQPPSSVNDAAFADVRYEPEQQTYDVGTIGGTQAAPWTEPAAPTYAQCVEAIQTQPYSSQEIKGLPYRRGEGLCFVAGGREAVGFVRGVSVAGSQAVQVEAIRWRAIFRR